MLTRETHSQMKAVSHIIGTVSATQTPSNGVDLAGFEACDFVIHIGAITNIAESPTPSWAFKMQESDSQSSGFTDVVNSDHVMVSSSQAPIAAPDASTGVFLTIDAADEDDKVYRAAYLGSKRYARIVATADETPGATPMSVVAMLGNAHLVPADDG